MTVSLHLGDCLEILKTIEDGSKDAIVTDPPAGIAFMGKHWDTDKGGRDAWIAWLAEVMGEGLRVLKPGGHALVWSLPRTSHWTGMALEDAGFEVRDCLVHLFGSGFPKSLSIDKAIDKAAGAEREVIGMKPRNGGGRAAPSHEGWQRPWMQEDGARDKPFQVTAPATPDAQRWQGWGTALKPAAEYWWLCRKPLVGTVAGNVLAYGTGAINVDGCRIETTVGEPNARANKDGNPATKKTSYCGGWGNLGCSWEGHAGRWPANVVLSHTPECRQVGIKRIKGGGGAVYTHSLATNGYEGGWGDMGPTEYQRDADGMETVEVWECAPDCPAAMLDEMSGIRTSNSGKPFKRHNADNHDGYNCYGKYANNETVGYYGDTGGASRFYYCAKSSRRERDQGLPEGTRNTNPCVKPISLCRWLTKLICPQGGTVLDPFMGSGSIGCAAVLEGFSFVGIDQSAEDVEIAKARIAYWQGQAEQKVMQPALV